MDIGAAWLELESPASTDSLGNADSNLACGVSAVLDGGDGPLHDGARALPDDDAILAILLGTKAQNEATAPAQQLEDLDSTLFFNTGSGSAESAESAAADASVEATARAEIVDAYKQAFALLDENPEHYWAREFLLDNSPHVVAHMLTNPAALAQAASADYFNNLVETDDKFGGMFDAANEFSYIFIPAFTSGNLVAGISATRSALSKGGVFAARSSEPDHGRVQGRDLLHRSSYMFCTGRFVRDVRDSRAIVVIHENASSHRPPSQTNVWYSQPLTSTRFEYVHMSCDGPLFARGNIIESIRTCLRGRHVRFCPLCGGSPNLNCGCPTPKCKAVDAQDSPVACEVQYHRPSEYLGNPKAVVVVPRAAGPNASYFSASLVSNSRVATYMSRDARHNELASLCQSFAVQLSLADRSPTLAIMPGAGGTGCSFATRAGTVNDARSGEPWVTDVSGVNNCEHDCNGTLLDREGNAFDSQILDCLQSGIESLEGGGRQLWDVGVEVVGLPQEIETAGGYRGRVNVPARYEGPASELGTLSGDMRGGGPQPDEKALRKMRKVLRNREAAARSNARRKERNVALRSNLADIRQQAAALRKKDAELRAENLALRRNLATATELNEERLE
jgi:hypothetical protein